MRPRLHAPGWLFAAALACAPSFAAGQPPVQPAAVAAEDLEEARALYEAGHAAARAERWADAAEQFARSYALSGAPPALFNLAFAYRAMGRHRDAAETFRALVERHREQIDIATRERARALSASEAARVAELRLLELRDDPHQLTVDGRARIDQGQRPWRLRLDPGSHALSVSLLGYDVFRWEGTLADGERLDLRVVLTALAPAAPAERRDWWRSSVLWTVVGVVALGAAAALTVALTVDGSSSLQPRSDRRVTL